MNPPPLLFEFHKILSESMYSPHIFTTFSSFFRSIKFLRINFFLLYTQIKCKREREALWIQCPCLRPPFKIICEAIQFHKRVFATTKLTCSVPGRRRKPRKVRSTKIQRHAKGKTMIAVADRGARVAQTLVNRGPEWLSRRAAERY